MSEFNPADHNLDKVNEYLRENPDQLESVLELEKARGDAARKTLVSDLEERLTNEVIPAEPVAVEVSPEPVDVKRVGGENYTVDPNKGYRYAAGRPVNN